MVADRYQCIEMGSQALIYDEHNSEAWIQSTNYVSRDVKAVLRSP